MALSALTMGESDRVAFWKNIKAFYDGDLFCDLVFICKGGLSVTCHQLVLASLSKKLATMLKAANETMEESFNTVHLPDLSYKEVQECVDFLYAILAIELPRETKITLKSEVVKTMGLDVSQLGLPTKAGEVEASSEDEEEGASEEEWSPSPEDSSAVSLKEVRRPLKRKRREEEEEEEEADSDRETKKAKLGLSDKENQIGSSQVIRLVTMSGALSSSSATPSSSKAITTTTTSSSPVLKLSGAAQQVKLLPGAKVTTAVVRTADGQEKKVILAVKNPSVVETQAPTKSGATKKGLTFPHRKNVACRHCKKEFQTWRLLKAHKTRDHPTKPVWGYTCDQCNEMFPLEGDLDQHMMEKHEGKGPHKCQEEGCGAAYLVRNSLVRHMNMHHGPNSKPWFPIGVKPSDSVERKKLMANRKRRLKNSKKLIDDKTGDVIGFQCLVCQKIDKKCGSHYVHLKNHETMTCEDCGQTFEGISKLSSHRVAAHSEKVTCDQCGKIFASTSSLYLHKKRKHVQDHMKPHGCNHCEKRFFCKSELNAHKVQVHIRDRRFVCRFGCGAAYNDYGSMSGHEKKQHGSTFKQAQAAESEAAGETRSAVASIQPAPPASAAPAAPPGAAVTAQEQRPKTRGKRKKQEQAKQQKQQPQPVQQQLTQPQPVQQQQQQPVQQQQLQQPVLQPGQLVQQNMPDGTVVFHYPVAAPATQHANCHGYGTF